MAGKAVRRRLNVLSLAFLDVMFCGFGAVILLFLILDHNTSDALVETDAITAAEIDLLEQEVLEGEDNRVQIRNTIDEISLEIVAAEGLAERIQEQIDDFLQQLAALENSGLNARQLRLEVERLEQELLELQSTALVDAGDSGREFVGEGNRQYLSGMHLGGQRNLILLDSSASMLDETIVNILRTRNMSDDRKRNADKWQRSVRTADWIVANLSRSLPFSRYQIIHFAEDFAPLLEGTDGQWLEVADDFQLNMVANAMQDLVPQHGTNLERVFRGIGDFEPLPDNVYLITDGLPTLRGRQEGDGSRLVRPSLRLDFFEDAMDELPEGVRVNVILMPLEGDEHAAEAYGRLASTTGGSFLAPSEDWP